MGNTASDHSIRARLYKERRNNISWNDFLFAIKEMNVLCKAVMEPNGDYLCFALAKNSEQTLLWKHNVRILCFKVNYNTKQIVSCKSLNFDEFMNALTLKKSMQAGAIQGDSMTTSRMILAETADSDGVCVICMDCPNQVLLPCLHAFCLVCVSQQMEFRTPFCCPVCRTPIRKPLEDSWEVADIPQPHEVAEYLSKITSSQSS